MSFDSPPSDLQKELLKTSDLIFDKIEFDELTLGSDEYNATHSIFNEVIFNGAFILDHVNLAHGMCFIKSVFKDKFIFKDIVIDRYHPVIMEKSVSLTFSDCTFSQEVQIFGTNTIIEKDIIFENCLFEKGIEINGITVADGELNFKNCTVNQKLNISNSKIKRPIEFVSNALNSSINLINLKTVSILFTGRNIVLGHLSLHSSKLDKGVTFIDGLFKDVVNFSLIEAGKFLAIFGSTFESQFTVHFHAIEKQPSRGFAKFLIRDAKFETGFHVFGRQELSNVLPVVEELTVDFSSKLTGNILFQNLDIGSIVLSGYNSGAKLTLKHLNVNQVRIIGMINEGGLIFSNLRASLTEWKDEANNICTRKKSAFYIDDANLGKTQFFQTDFRSFEIIAFHNVILTEISTSLVTWFSKVQLEEGYLAKSLDLFKAAQKSNSKVMIIDRRNDLLNALTSKKEIFRQLKYASQKQGDIPLSLEFQRHEMEYYQMIVKYQESKNWSEHLILWSSKSNNFGQSWLKALMYLLIVSFVTYLPIGFLTSEDLDYSEFLSSLSEFNLNLRVVFSDNIKSWFILLNPTHRTLDLARSNASITGWVYFWDILSRITVAYFIFQVVSAFRKFNK